jgi:carboxymethylenebutenolidase
MEVNGMSDTTGKYVIVRTTDGGSFRSYFAAPEAIPAPGVIVLQEIFGVSTFVRGVCDDLAHAGYAAIAPDLFWRQEPNVQLDSDIPADRERAVKLMHGLDEPLAVEDAAAAVAYLRSQQHCTGKVGALGFCLGGKLAYLLAARTNLDAAVSYYGVGIQKALGEAGKLRVPLLLHIAADDQMCPPEAQQEIGRALGTLPMVTIFTHDGVGHAFAREGSAAYKSAAAQSAKVETESFLATHLGKTY